MHKFSIQYRAQEILDFLAGKTAIFDMSDNQHQPESDELAVSGGYSEKLKTKFEG